MIMCDVDGIIADFDEGARRAHGISLERDNASRAPGVWGMAEAWGITLKEFWSKLDNYEFWSSVPEFEGGFEFIKALRELGPVSFVTQPSRSPGACTGKIEWLQKRYSQEIPLYLTMGPKWVMAKAENLLIDDWDLNIERWRGAGGPAIKFPRRWNSDHQLAEGVTDLYDYVLEKVRSYKFDEVHGVWVR